MKSCQRWVRYGGVEGSATQMMKVFHLSTWHPSCPGQPRAASRAMWRAWDRQWGSSRRFWWARPGSGIHHFCPRPVGSDLGIQQTPSDCEAWPEPGYVQRWQGKWVWWAANQSQSQVRGWVSIWDESIPEGKWLRVTDANTIWPLSV